MKKQKLPLDVLHAVEHAYDKDVLDVFVRDGTAYSSDGCQAAWCKVVGVPDGTYHKENNKTGWRAGEYGDKRRPIRRGGDTDGIQRVVQSTVRDTSKLVAAVSPVPAEMIAALKRANIANDGPNPIAALVLTTDGATVSAGSEASGCMFSQPVPMPGQAVGSISVNPDWLAKGLLALEQRAVSVVAGMVASVAGPFVARSVDGSAGYLLMGKRP
jgi:hypothetical protein